MNPKIIVNSSYDVSGPDHFPGLLLIHGSKFTRKMWLPQLRNLSDTFHVIAPDLPGHGAFEQTPFNFLSAVHTIAEITEKEANGRALIAGLSLGGYVAIQFAEKYPEKQPC